MTLSQQAKELLSEIIKPEGGVRKDKTRAIAFVARGSKRFDHFASRFGGTKEGKTPYGMVVVETLSRHPDSLSVTGVYIHATDSSCPTMDYAYILEDADGKPDLAHAFRDGGKLARILDRVI